MYKIAFDAGVLDTDIMLQLSETMTEPMVSEHDILALAPQKPQIV